MAELDQQADRHCKALEALIAGVREESVSMPGRGRKSQSPTPKDNGRSALGESRTTLGVSTVGSCTSGMEHTHGGSVIDDLHPLNYGSDRLGALEPLASTRVGNQVGSYISFATPSSPFSNRVGDELASGPVHSSSTFGAIGRRIDLTGRGCASIASEWRSPRVVASPDLSRSQPNGLSNFKVGMGRPMELGLERPQAC